MLDDALITAAPTTAPRTDTATAPLRIRTLPGVYDPQFDSWLLARELRREPLGGRRVLDLCTGSGLLATTAAQAGAGEVVAVDVSRRAVATARMNLRRNRLRGTVVRGDLVDAAPDGTFDVIVSNPPYVPVDAADVPARGAARAWDAGHDGRLVLDRICTAAPARLAPGGALLLVHSHVCGAERTLDLLAGQGLRASVVARHEQEFGPVMRRRAEFLRSAGLIDADARHEELVVVRATRPPTAMTG